MGVKQFKTKKPIVLRTAVISVIFISGLFIWITLPGSQATLASLIPPGTFIFASLKINLNDSGVSDLMNNLRLIANNPIVKIKERFFIKFIMPFFIPTEVATTFILNSKTKNPDYLIFIKSSRLARLFRLSAFLKLKPIKGKTYTVFKDVIIVSRQFSLVEIALNSYKQRPTFLSSGLLDFFRALRDTKDGVIFVNNIDSYFSQFIKNLEREYAYIIFPTVDSIKWISGGLDVINSDKAKGSFTFKYKELTDAMEVKKDIHFFAEIFHRFFRANGLNSTQEIVSYSDSIELNFEISGLRRLMVSLLSQKGGK